MTGIASDHSPHAARYNLRDFGGIALVGGGQIVSGRLFRSGQLDPAQPQDHGLVARLPVDKVVDLRGSSELSESQSPAFAGFIGQILRAGQRDHMVPHAMAEIASLTSLAEVRQRMTQVYVRLPDSLHFRETLRLLFVALAEAKQGVLVHCFAGKDRTGLCVALFQRWMGAHREDVMDDYLATNAMGEDRLVDGIAYLRAQSPAIKFEDWQLREVMAVRAEYLEAALTVIDRDENCPVTYVEKVTGLTRQRMEAIKAGYRTA